MFWQWFLIVVLAIVASTLGYIVALLLEVLWAYPYWLAIVWIPTISLLLLSFFRMDTCEVDKVHG